jgi:glycosyltransferase involved in cell wall biosynthesis
VRDLIVTPYTPSTSTGRGLRTYGIVRALSAARGLDILYVRFGAEQPDAVFRAVPNVSFVGVEAGRGPRRVAAFLGAVGAGVPADFARGVSPELIEAATSFALQPDRGRVIADGPVAAAALLQLAARRPLIYNAHNLESQLRPALGGRWRWSAQRLARFERRLLARYSESWIVSGAELAAAQRLCPNARLRYVPNVIDVERIEPITVRPETPRAVFIADFQYLPNRHGLRFLVEEVMPVVWRKEPRFELGVVGRGLRDRDLPADPRITYHGFVEALTPIYSAARCVVVPLLEGGGSPLKLLEALAYGLPVVTTEVGVRGLDGVQDGIHLLVADGAAQFAERMVVAVEDGQAALGAAGRALVEERYSIAALARLLAA